MIDNGSRSLTSPTRLNPQRSSVPSSALDCGSKHESTARRASTRALNSMRKTIAQGQEKAALVTPCLSHLPLHPSCILGYGAAVLEQSHDLDVFDFNALMHVRQQEKLKPILDVMDASQIVSDEFHLYPFYQEVNAFVDELYGEVPWENYPWVYITPPTWFPTVPADAIVRLSRSIWRVSPKTEICFFGNSLGSWTDEEKLRNHGVQLRHLNDLHAAEPTIEPVRYDGLPTPVYRHRENYLLPLLPFALKHGCAWGRCKFCSFCSGWNTGHLERSAAKAIEELEILIDRYDPPALVCRDHSLNGQHLMEFCRSFERFQKDWCGQSRADLTEEQIAALRKSGCKLIYFGLESGSDRMLQSVNKGITSQQMSDFMRRLHSYEIFPAPSVVIGAPGEERSDFEKTIQFLVDHRRYVEVVNAYPFMTTPASDFTSRGGQPNRDVTIRLFEFIRTCEDLGLKISLGEQSIEHFLYTWLCTRQPQASRARNEENSESVAGARESVHRLPS